MTAGADPIGIDMFAGAENIGHEAPRGMACVHRRIAGAGRRPIARASYRRIVAVLLRARIVRQPA